MILHLVEANNGPFVYVDAHEEYLTPDEARRAATKLLELAHRAEHPIDDAEWP